MTAGIWLLCAPSAESLTLSTRCQLQRPRPELNGAKGFSLLPDASGRHDCGSSWTRNARTHSTIFRKRDRTKRDSTIAGAG